MAIIKKEWFCIGGVDMQLPIKCDAQGNFWVDIPKNIREEMAIDRTVKLYKDTLEKALSTARDLIKDFNESKRERFSIIVVTFRVSKDFTLRDGIVHPTLLKFTRCREQGFSDEGPKLSFKYDIVLEEHVGERKNYFRLNDITESSEGVKEHLLNDEKEFIITAGDKMFRKGGYYSPLEIAGGVIIPYSNEAHDNLEFIKNNITKMCGALLDLLGRDDLSKVLTSGSTNNLLDK